MPTQRDNKEERLARLELLIEENRTRFESTRARVTDAIAEGRQGTARAKEVVIRARKSRRKTA